MKKVVYPYSNLKKHHSHYKNLLVNYFNTFYGGLRIQIQPQTEEIVIQIFDVEGFPMYDPNDFDVVYRVKPLSLHPVQIYMISSNWFFEDFYKYMPDLCPYISFHLFTDDYELFMNFTLRDIYYDMECKKMSCNY